MMNPTRRVTVFWAEDDYDSLKDLFSWPNVATQVRPAFTYVDAVKIIEQKPQVDVFVIDLILRFSPLPPAQLPVQLRELYDRALDDMANIDALKRSLYWGSKLISVIKDTPEYHMTPIVALSAVANSVTSSMQQELGIADVIPKRGIRVVELQNRILRVLPGHVDDDID